MTIFSNVFILVLTRIKCRYGRSCHVLFPEIGMCARRFSENSLDDFRDSRVLKRKCGEKAEISNIFLFYFSLGFVSQCLLKI